MTTAIHSAVLAKRSLLAIALSTFIVLLMMFATAGAAELPSDSIYRLDIPLIDHNGVSSHLADRRGRPQLISMFYTSCQFVCPLVLDTLRMTQRSLDAAEQRRLDVLVVSFDPGRDTPTRLKSVFDKRRLDSERWTLARTEAPNVRKFAAALDIRYRVLADGEINHATALVLLDAEGRIVARTSVLSEIDPDFVAAIRATLSTGSGP
jgi:protein SCO1/2